MCHYFTCRRYLSDRPAPPHDSSAGHLLQVNVSMDLFAVREIDEVGFTLSLELGLYIEWIDTRCNQWQ